MARSLLWFLNTAARSAAVPTDAELLRRYATTRDGGAFELLVRRHAAGVWAACRRVLRNDDDADDAFQATFVTLARKARAVRAGRCLGGWLHRVAVNAGLKLRAKKRVTVALPEVPVSPPEADDSAAVLHEELAGLPAAYRAVLVAVDLEEHSHSDAAALLGWPVGTVFGRLARARAELRRRLERRGITAATVGGAAVAHSTVRAAVEVAVGAVVARPEVLSLSAEVWAMVTTAKRKLAAAVAAGLIGVAVLGGTGLVAVAQPPKATSTTERKVDPPSKPPETPQKNPAADPDEEKRLAELKKREEELRALFADESKLPKLVAADSDTAEVKAAKEWLKSELERYHLIKQRVEAGQFQGGAAYLQLTDTIGELTAAADEVFVNPKDRLPWYEFRLQVIEQVEKFNKPRVEKGVEEPQLLPQLRAARAKAELALLKLKKQIK